VRHAEGFIERIDKSAPIEASGDLGGVDLKHGRHQTTILAANPHKWATYRD
jgi:hypothetical protein